VDFEFSRRLFSLSDLEYRSGGMADRLKPVLQRRICQINFSK